MGTLEEWLAQRGSSVALALDNEREAICDAVSSHLALAFPALCYDPARPDALAFQQRAYHETPRRFHRLLQVVLQLQTLTVIEREYRWGWPVIRRYGVERQQVLDQARWYFEATRTFVALPPDDAAQLHDLASAILHTIDLITSGTPAAPANELRLRNGFHP